MAKKEQIYAEQLKALGIYDTAFDAEIHTLAILEREHSRTLKAWKETADDGKAPSVTEKLYAVIAQQRKDILAHRDALGLTPKAYRRLRQDGLNSVNNEPIGSANKQLSVLLDELREKSDGCT